MRSGGVYEPVDVTLFRPVTCIESSLLKLLIRYLRCRLVRVEVVVVGVGGD